MTENQLKIMAALYAAFNEPTSMNALPLGIVRKLTGLDQPTVTSCITQLKRVKYVQSSKGSQPTRFALTAKGMTAYEEVRDGGS